MEKRYFICILLFLVQLASSKNDAFDLESTFNSISGALRWVKLKEYLSAINNFHTSCQEELRKCQVDKDAYRSIPSGVKIGDSYKNTFCFSSSIEDEKQKFGLVDLGNELDFVTQRHTKNKILSLMHFFEDNLVRYFYQSNRGTVYYIEEPFKKLKKILRAHEDKSHYIIKRGNGCVVTVTQDYVDDNYTIKLWKYDGKSVAEVIFAEKNDFNDEYLHIVDVVPCINDASLLTVVLDNHMIYLIDFLNEAITTTIISTKKVGTINLFLQVEDGFIFGSSKNENCFGLWAFYLDDKSDFFNNKKTLDYFDLWEFDCESKIFDFCLILPYLLLLKDDQGFLTLLYLFNGEDIFSVYNAKMEEESTLHFENNFIYDINLKFYQRYSLTHFSRVLDKFPLSNLTIAQMVQFIQKESFFQGASEEE